MWIKRIVGIVLVASVGVGSFVILRGRNTKDGAIKEIRPTRGSIQLYISTTGTVLPKNRLEVKPPVNGRVDAIYVQEGDKVKAGQELAQMSSTERAALLDAARSKGDESLRYWQEAYKPILLISPINGEVIVSKTQPGQTVTASDAVVVLSDQLIVRAQVDETDIGKVKEGQEANITLDAYPDTRLDGHVEHIYYESKTVNNVTIYEVDLVVETMPTFFRSGMNATVDFKDKSTEMALLIPLEAVQREKDRTWVFVRQDGDKEPVRREVQLGISDDINVEVVSGLSENDTVIVKPLRYSLPKRQTEVNPFMPRPRGR